MKARRLVIFALVIVALAIGGPFVYINFIKADAPAKFTLSATASGGAADSVPLDGTWSVAAGSEAGYRVGEVLVGQNSTAVGRTDVITGTMTIKGSTVESGSFTADMRATKSEQPTRDRAFHRRIMDTTKYPTATFTLTKPIDIGSPPANAEKKQVSATGNLSMHGTTKAITIPLTTDHSGTTVRVVGSYPIVFADWGIANPSYAGLVTTKDRGELEFLLILKHGMTEAVTTTTPTTEAAPADGQPHGPMTPPTVTPTTLAPLQIPS
jgi:polyisoprenoid-binding protein YceI